MPRSKVQIDKATEKSKLKVNRAFTITIEASELNIQRIVALMLYSDRPPPDLIYVDPVLPGEDAPVLEDSIDWAAVRNVLTKHIVTYATAAGSDAARAMLLEFGGAKLSEVPQENLLSLNASLEAAIKETV